MLKIYPMSFFLALAVTACSPPLPPETPIPTATTVQTPPPVTSVDEISTELFWIGVDWVGDASGHRNINRNLDFEDAKRSTRESLSSLLSLKTEALEKAGITPSDTFPYCIDVLTASFHLDAMTEASSPAQAGPHINKAIVSIQQLETAVSEAVHIPEKAGWKDKEFCDPPQLPR